MKGKKHRNKQQQEMQQDYSIEFANELTAAADAKRLGKVVGNPFKNRH